MKKALLLIFLSSMTLWSQERNPVLINEEVFSYSDGYLISNAYHSIYDTSGWLWIIGENELSDAYTPGEKKIVMQRFDSAHFFNLKIPKTSDKKIKDGHFFKHQEKGLYLKLYYETTIVEWFFIDTETLEITAVNEVNDLDKKDVNPNDTYTKAFVNEIMNDYSGSKSYDFKTGLITKIENQNSPITVFKELGKDLVILNGNTLTTYHFKEHSLIDSFNPKNTVQEDIDAQVQFTSISFFNSETGWWQVNTSPSSIKNTNEIRLPSEYRRFSATISIFGAINPQDVSYRCRMLNGEGDSWFSCYPSREILYANLAAGTYTLQIEALDASKKKIGKTLELIVISEEVFYKTWWFIGLSLLIITGVLLFLFYQYKQKQNLFAKNQIALNEAEVKGAMMLEIHHRIKNNLQIVSGLLGLQMANNDNEELKSKLQNSQSRIESIAGIHNLLYSTDGQNSVPVKENVESIVRYYKMLFFIKIAYHIDVDTSILNVDKATPFSLLLNELINNSNKHAFTNVDSPEIFIYFKKKNDGYLFEYSDNGVFKKSENKKESMGMKIIRMMSKQLKGELNIEDTSNFKLTLFFSVNE